MAYDPQGMGPAGGMGPGGGMGRRGRRRLSTETRRSFETSEFWAYIVVAIGVLIAAAMIEGDDDGGGGEGGGGDFFRADDAWVLVVILTVGYMLSRGWAKSGAREFHWDDAEGRGVVDRVRDTVTGEGPR